MNTGLLKAAAAFMPTCLLFSGSVILFFKRRNAGSSLQLIGTACLMLVAYFMSAKRSVSFQGLKLFPIGYLLDAVRK